MDEAVALPRVASLRPGADGRKTKFENLPHPGQAVPPDAHFLSFGKRASKIIDRQFKRNITFPHQLDDKLDVEIKPVGDQVDTEKPVAAEQLEHCERVAHLRVEPHVYQRLEK